MKNVYSEKYQAAIGLEVHVQLATRSKLFAADSADYGGEPNAHISAISLAYPGTLPRVNKKAVEYAVRMGLACGSEITRVNNFDRKNYFYPDLPKGFQLTQYRTPICRGGALTIGLAGTAKRTIRINRIHLEEDAGKSVHDGSETETLLDFNRAGVALIEIVTEPELQSPEEAGAFVAEIRRLVRYLGISDGNMEEGSLRCDVNVSIRLKDSLHLGKKVEIKNLNSIRNVQRAIGAEIRRQVERSEAGQSISSETRTFDASAGISSAMRAKEELNDYRYFPEPDISPVILTDEWIHSIQESMPLLPWQVFDKLIAQYGLPEYDAGVLTESRETANYFMEVCARTPHYKAASNWLMGPVKSYLNDNPGGFPVSAGALAELIELVEAGHVSFSVASQRIFPELINNPVRSPLDVAQQLNVIQETDTGKILQVIERVLNDYPAKVTEYKKGKKGIMAMFMGEVMKRTQGKADPKLATEFLRKQLENQ